MYPPPHMIHVSSSSYDTHVDRQRAHLYDFAESRSSVSDE